jgi:hypothetical protein
MASQIVNTAQWIPLPVPIGSPPFAPEIMVTVTPKLIKVGTLYGIKHPDSITNGIPLLQEGDYLCFEGVIKNTQGENTEDGACYVRITSPYTLDLLDRENAIIASDEISTGDRALGTITVDTEIVSISNAEFFVVRAGNLVNTTIAGDATSGATVVIDGLEMNISSEPVPITSPVKLKSGTVIYTTARK